MASFTSLRGQGEDTPLETEIPAAPPGVHFTRLENGLTIIVREDHSAPVVSAQAWCMAGSIHEGSWLGAGLSHVLEHMLFKGTTTRPGSRIDQEVQEAGGYMNAYTSFDRTVYHIDVPNTGATVAIDILCDIMQNATLPEDELEKEKKVIVREMDMNSDDPGRRASRRLFETAYTRSPYRFTIIGYPDIFHELTTQDIKDYYREKYSPGNVFFVIAGDVKNQEVVSQVTAAYATAKARAVAPVALAEEPPQVAAREVVEEAPIEMGYLHMAWHIPALRHPDVPLLDVLAAVLGSGRSSRLYQNVREAQGVVHSADAWTYSPGNAGLFGISAMLDGGNYEVARAALLKELERVRAGVISDQELAKAKKQFISGMLATRKTMQGQAQDLGSNWLAANDLNFSERYLAAVRQATCQDLHRAATTYLTPGNRTLYALLPQGAKPGSQAESSPSAQHSIQQVILPNGLRLLLKEDHRLSFVEFRAVFKGGVLSETKANSGGTQLMAKLLLKGTKSRSAEQLATEIESVGGSLDSYGGNNSFGVNAEVLSEDFNIGLGLLADVLRNPTFPEQALEREREVQVATIRAHKDHLLHSASQAMRKALFGESGYGLEATGSEESVQQLTAGDLLRFHQTYAAPNNCVLAIYGDIQPEAAKAAVEAALGDWKPAEAVMVAIKAAAEPENRRVTEERDKKQAVLVVGFPGTTLHSPDRYALDLLQETCSDMGSRLFLRVREKLGLAYYVGAQNFIGLAPGYFSFYAGTEPEKASLVEQELLTEARLLAAEGLTADELRRAKAKILGQRKIARQDLGGLAMATALDELYGLGFDASEKEDALYESVSLEQVREVAGKYLAGEKVVVATVRPPASSSEASA
jgi:zinc protease